VGNWCFFYQSKSGGLSSFVNQVSERPDNWAIVNAIPNEHKRVTED